MEVFSTYNHSTPHDGRCPNTLYGSCLYYAEQLKNKKDKKKVKEDIKKLSRFWTKLIMSVAKEN